MDNPDKVKYLKRQVFSKILDGRKVIVEYKDDFEYFQYFLINKINEGKLSGNLVKKLSCVKFDLNKFVKKDFRLADFTDLDRIEPSLDNIKVNYYDKARCLKKQVLSKILDGKRVIAEYEDQFLGFQYLLINQIKNEEIVGKVIEKQDYNEFGLKEFVKRYLRISHFKTIEESVGEE